MIRNRLRLSFFAAICLVCASTTINAATVYIYNTLPPSSDFPNDSTSFTVAVALNNFNQEAGYEGLVAGGPTKPVLWNRGVPIPLTMPTGFTTFTITGLNNLGHVSGTVCPSGNGPGCKAVIWSSGSPNVLADDLASCPTGSTVNSTSAGINNAGQVVGQTTVDACVTTWVWTGSAFDPLMTITPAGINAAGQVVGPSVLGGNPAIAVVQAGQNTEYYTAPSGYSNVKAVQINNKDNFLATGTDVSSVQHVLFNIQGIWNDIGPGANASLNQLNQVVGEDLTNPQQPGLFVWQNGTKSPIVAPVGVTPTFTNPALVSDAGIIVFPATLTVGSAVAARAIVLQPTYTTCAVNSSNLVQVTKSPTKSEIAGYYLQEVLIKNGTTTTIAAPISLVFDKIDPDATVANTSGSTLCTVPNGSSFITLQEGLAPGATATFYVLFAGPMSSDLSYSTRLLSNTGGR